VQFLVKLPSATTARDRWRREAVEAGRAAPRGPPKVARLGYPAPPAVVRCVWVRASRWVPDVPGVLLLVSNRTGIVRLELSRKGHGRDVHRRG
jgi:hypothetical protein